MKEEINEKFLCVLRKNKADNQIELDWVEIINPLEKVIGDFLKICKNEATTLVQIISFIKNTSELNQLSQQYRYCESLSSAFQGFVADNLGTITEINNRQQIISQKKKEKPHDFDEKKAIQDFKTELSQKYILWGKAYAINKTYRLCHEDNSILTFSHRIDGWSNPVYQLTPNFSIEVKTNFGYGSASYFYTRLKYKSIEITPFSEWIDYEFAKFSEIVRYTQSYLLRNEYWFDAMEFSRDACNLSMTDEVQFVEKYVIGECERMVSGLEEIFNKEHFKFKNRERNHYTVDKKGHILVEFRGEKISGALDFISKILEFERIVSIKSFIVRIEEYNRRIQPILVEEAKILKVKIENLKQEKNYLQPKYDEVVKINNDYNQKRVSLQKEMVAKKKLNPNCIDTSKLESEFISNYPEYNEFMEKYKKITDSYRILTAQIKNNTKVRDNIISYNEKIVKYFGK